MVQGQVFLKRSGGGGVALFQYLSFLHLEIISLSAKLCYRFEEKLLFSANIILWKKKSF